MDPSWANSHRLVINPPPRVSLPTIATILAPSQLGLSSFSMTVFPSTGRIPTRQVPPLTHWHRALISSPSSMLSTCTTHAWLAKRVPSAMLTSAICALTAATNSDPSAHTPSILLIMVELGIKIASGKSVCLSFQFSSQVSLSAVSSLAPPSFLVVPADAVLLLGGDRDLPLRPPWGPPPPSSLECS